MKTNKMEVIMTKTIHNLMSENDAIVIKFDDEKYLVTKEEENINITKITTEDDELLQNAEDGQLFFIEE